MAFKTMYPPQKDSPSTFLLGDISAVDTLMTVASAAALPQTLPYPLTIGIDKNLTETVMVIVQNLGNNQLTITRGTPAYAWVAGSKAARVLRATDFLDVQDNLRDVDTRLTTTQGTVSTHGTDISTLKTTVGGAGSGLVKGLADEIVRATAAEGAESARATAAESNLNTIKINRSELAQVITDWAYSADETKVQVTITRYNASTQQTTQYARTLPVVSDEDMGVMTPEAYAEITALRNDVNSLINLGGRFIGVSFATKAALTAYVVPSNVKTGDFTYVIDDETKSGATTRYVRNESVWDFTFIIDYDPIGIANTTTLGVVKSSTTDGKVFVETDGTMSVIGWGNLKTRVTTVESNLSALTQDSIPDGTTNKAYTATEKTKLAGVATGANKYTHPTTAGNKHIPSGGASGQVLKYSASGTAVWGTDNDTVTTINGKTGAIAKADIVALGIPAQDTVYTHPANHSPSIITQNASNRFVTDAEKTAWNAKLDASQKGVANGVASLDGTGKVPSGQLPQVGLIPRIIVTAPTGSNVTCAKGGTTLTATESSGTWTFNVPDYGTWTVTATLSSDTKSADVVVDQVKLYTTSLSYLSDTFSANTWEDIIGACQSGSVPETWVVGNQKTMTINSASYTVTIIGKGHDSYTGGGTAPITFQLQDCYGTKNQMNGTDTNSGGWASCAMRTTHLLAILALMPSEVQTGIKAVDKMTSAGSQSSTINTSSDKLFLLSEIEIFGSITSSKSGEGSQYAYYSAGNSEVKNFSGSAYIWWERSPNGSKSTNFCYVNSSGGASGGSASAAYGVAFGFCF